VKRYLVIVQQAENNYAAYSPDVPGCVATGATVEETLSLMQEALASHLEITVKYGEEIPEPASVAAVFVSVPEPQAA
jgi:predicted RNase H-like HicB family nuclease